MPQGPNPLQYVRQVAADGVFAAGGRQHTYLTFHTGPPPVVVAWCAHNEPATTGLQPGDGLPPCRSCTTVARGANVCATGTNRKETDQ